MKSWQIARESVLHEVSDDEGMCYGVERASNGTLTVLVRACGQVTIDGVKYEYDRDFRIKLKRTK